VLASLLLGCCIYQLCCSPAALGTVAAAPAIPAPVIRPVYVPQPQPRIRVAPPIYARAPLPVRFAPARRASYYQGGIYGGGYSRFQ
jgi:hypothetical protein